jgi:hypothetical protein
MPTIYDNIEKKLLDQLNLTMAVSDRSDFCVGYFNLRGWRHLDSHVERWPGGDGHCCRLLVGMQKRPQDELVDELGFTASAAPVDQSWALRQKRQLAQDFRDQLTVGAPTDADEAGLRRLAAQITAGRLVVKLFLRHRLHAKLYLLHRTDPINPIVAYLGSSNLTLSGLSGQGELNVDVMDGDACTKLAHWFEDRWNDRWSIDISREIVQAIDESWAREIPLPPYHVYINMAYHLSREAREGLTAFRIPRDFGNKLFDFQVAAVKIAAQHLHKRGGVLLGDVVGLGKTLMATAVASIFEHDLQLETLIICPKNLVTMWQDYVYQYRLHARVMSNSVVQKQLAHLERYRLVILDESHNLRNREGKKYRAIHEYIQRNDCRCILLSATPYNKNYQDLSSQLRLFVSETADLGIRPERAIAEAGEAEFSRHQCGMRTLAAFEKSEDPDDWRELMRLYLVRRTRTFIKKNYAATDCPGCDNAVKPTDSFCTRCGRAKHESDRRYLTFEDGQRSYFPERLPRTARFAIDDSDPNDPYARLYSDGVVAAVNSLSLPRYGLGNYVDERSLENPTPAEKKLLDDLSRAGRRLMGFCRTNLFKRLESSGKAFMLSVERHIARNHVFLYALDNGLPLPVGAQDVALMDARFHDGDAEDVDQAAEDADDGQEQGDGLLSSPEAAGACTEADFQRWAARIYDQYRTKALLRFKWIRPDLFSRQLRRHLVADTAALMGVYDQCGRWDPRRDAKLAALRRLVTVTHPREKVLIFTQFADTVAYLRQELAAAGVTALEGATGQSEDPTALAWRFSPVSNGKRGRIAPEDEIRVLIATDVLSEGQNLQDAYIVVNFDLPWAIIRLVQRAGRVDRIGQKADNIFCYSFLPADGVERIIRLRARVRERLRENAEVVGTDEAFFEDDGNDQALRDLYTEKSGALDGEPDTEVDLASYAYQIWKNAITADRKLEKIIPALPPVIYSTKRHVGTNQAPNGVLLYMRTGQGNDALAWVDAQGRSVTQSQFAVLEAAACTPDTPGLERQPAHHDLVRQGVELIAKDEQCVGGQLGRPHGARRRAYDRLKLYAEGAGSTADNLPAVKLAIDDIYRFPLLQSATDALNRQLPSIDDAALAELVVSLRDDDRLCLVTEAPAAQEPRIICSLGLAPAA